MSLFVSKRFFCPKSGHCFYWCTFHNWMGTYPVNLSLIRAVQQNYEGFYYSKSSLGVVGFEAVKYNQNWFFGPTKVCQAFSWLFIALPNLCTASSVFCCDSLRFLTHPYTKEPKFLLLNPNNIIPAKVHVRLRISSCNMFNRFSRPLASRKS